MPTDLNEHNEYYFFVSADFNGGLRNPILTSEIFTLIVGCTSSL